MQKLFINGSQPDQAPKNVCLSLGCFDGIHLGHQQIIKKLKEESKKKQSPSCLCIFQPHPFKILKPDQDFKNLFTTSELEVILKKHDLDYVCMLAFDLNFSKLSAKDFIHSFLYPNFKPSSFVVGYDFSFGHNREGTFDFFKKESEALGFESFQIPAFLYKDEIVSSSRIKKNIDEGKIEEANSLLGYSFFVQAPVVKGDGRGSKIGFPTANLDVPENKILPKTGVYACRVKSSKGLHKAVMNLGFRPTFKADKKRTLEVHIIDENLDLYGDNLELEILKFIREERPFSGVFELKSQIQKDISEALKV